MKSNTTIPLGAIVMLKKVENHFGLFHDLFPWHQVRLADCRNLTAF